MAKLVGLSVVLVAAVCAFSAACAVPEVDTAEDVATDEATTAPRAQALTPAEIQATVRASFGSFQACYEAALGRDPKLEGKVVLDFTIDADGEVLSEIGEGSTIEDRGLTSCMVGVANGLVFEATGRETTVTYPIAFSPS